MALREPSVEQVIEVESLILDITWHLVVDDDIIVSNDWEHIC